MKKFLSLLLVILMIALPLVSCDADVPNDTETNTSTPETDSPSTGTPSTGAPTTDTPVVSGGEDLFVGYGKECITPYDENGNLPAGIMLAGYDEIREAKTVKSDLYVICTAIKDKDGDIALMFTADMHAITPENAKAVRRLVELATGVDEGKILFNVSHSHAAPGEGYLMENLKVKAPAAAKAAIEDLTRVTALYASAIEIAGLNFSRRYLYDADGNITGYQTEVDHTMPTVRFVREGGKKDVIMCNWAAHCDNVKGDSPYTISSDYLEPFRMTVEHDMDALVSLYNGAAGDMITKSRVPGGPKYPGLSFYGKYLAQQMMKGLEGLEPLEIKSDVKVLSEKVKVNYEHSTDHLAPQAEEIRSLYNAAGKVQTDEVKAKLEEYGIASIYEAMYIAGRVKWGVSTRLEVGALSIGNIVFAFAPYEMFDANGQDIKASGDGFDLAFMCAYTNGMIGYIPAEGAFEYGGYEVYSRLYEKGTAEILADAMIEMINELEK